MQPGSFATAKEAVSPLVISYTRFSTKRQAKGQSYQRQTSMALDWCKERGHQLDDTWCFHDPGVSGWSGENARSGELSVLLKLVEDGKIPRGSYLLIEAMDRLTRENLVPAVMLLTNILQAGIVLVTLQDRKELTEETARNPFEFMAAILALSSGNIESTRKSDMVGKAYAANRDAGKQQIFGTAPGWLWRKDKYSPWQVDEAKAESVRKVFALCIDGYGSSEIAKKANAEGWVVPTRLGNKKRGGGWPVTMPGKLIRNRAVIGEHEHRDRTHKANAKHWMGVSRGAPIPNYYPAIIDEKTFYAAQAATDRRRKPERRDAWYLNIWSGLLVCGKCGGGVHRKTDPHSKYHGQVRCRNAGAGLCDTPSMKIDAFDTMMLISIEIQGKGLHLQPTEDYTSLIDAELGQLSNIDAATERLAGIIMDNGDGLPVLRAKAKELAAERAKVQAKIEEYRQAQAEQAARMDDTTFSEDLQPLLYLRTEEAKAIRAEVNAKLRRIIEKIEVVGGQSAIVHYKGDDTPQFIPLDILIRQFEGRRPENLAKRNKAHSTPLLGIPYAKPRSSLTYEQQQELEAAVARVLDEQAKLAPEK